MGTKDNKKQIEMKYFQTSNLKIIGKITELNTSDLLTIIDFSNSRQLIDCAHEINMRLGMISSTEKKYLQTINEKDLTYKILRQE